MARSAAVWASWVPTSPPAPVGLSVRHELTAAAWTRAAPTAQVSTADAATVSYPYQWWVGTRRRRPRLPCVGIRRATLRGLPHRHLAVVISTYHRSQRDRFAERLTLSGVSGGGFVAEL